MVVLKNHKLISLFPFNACWHEEKKNEKVCFWVLDVRLDKLKSCDLKAGKTQKYVHTFSIKTIL